MAVLGCTSIARTVEEPLTDRAAHATAAWPLVDEYLIEMILERVTGPSTVSAASVCRTWRRIMDAMSERRSSFAWYLRGAVYQSGRALRLTDWSDSAAHAYDGGTPQLVRQFDGAPMATPWHAAPDSRAGPLPGVPLRNGWVRRRYLDRLSVIVGDELDTAHRMTRLSVDSLYPAMLAGSGIDVRPLVATTTSESRDRSTARKRLDLLLTIASLIRSAAGESLRCVIGHRVLWDSCFDMMDERCEREAREAREAAAPKPMERVSCVEMPRVAIGTAPDATPIPGWNVIGVTFASDHVDVDETMLRAVMAAMAEEELMIFTMSIIRQRIATPRIACATSWAMMLCRVWLGIGAVSTRYAAIRHDIVVALHRYLFDGRIVRWMGLDGLEALLGRGRMICYTAHGVAQHLIAIAALIRKLDAYDAERCPAEIEQLVASSRWC